MPKTIYKIGDTNGERTLLKRKSPQGYLVGCNMCGNTIITTAKRAFTKGCIKCFKKIKAGLIINHRILIEDYDSYKQIAPWKCLFCNKIIKASKNHLENYDCSCRHRFKLHKIGDIVNGRMVVKIEGSITFVKCPICTSIAKTDGSTIKKCKKCSGKKILQYNKKGIFIKEYYSSMQIEIELGIPRGNIILVCKNKKYHKTAGGFIWKYKNNENI